ncbi:hypothetical protein F2Q69_00009834 [Brassica cretica]|uniref:Uncharacterized protein n=1 Tax=Brassica cretica TaxID=69181 RepID=A0A8S9NQC8_BRACR|nr:hypothetical protein F2Q69_00009834 [Brassica cretica]
MIFHSEAGREGHLLPSSSFFQRSFNLRLVDQTVVAFELWWSLQTTPHQLAIGLTELLCSTTSPPQPKASRIKRFGLSTRLHQASLLENQFSATNIRASTTLAASLSLRPLDEHKMVVVKRNKARYDQREREETTQAANKRYQRPYQAMVKASSFRDAPLMNSLRGNQHVGC